MLEYKESHLGWVVERGFEFFTNAEERESITIWSADGIAEDDYLFASSDDALEAARIELQRKIARELEFALPTLERTQETRFKIYEEEEIIFHISQKESRGRAHRGQPPNLGKCIVLSVRGEQKKILCGVETQTQIVEVNGEEYSRQAEVETILPTPEVVEKTYQVWIRPLTVRLVSGPVLHRTS